MIKQLYSCSCSLFFFALLTFNSSASNPGPWSVKWENPRVFTENKGQFHSENPSEKILYAFDDGQNMIYFSEGGLTFKFIKREKKEHEKRAGKKSGKEQENEEEENKASCTSDRVHLLWENANPAPQIVAEEETEAYRSYSFMESGVMKNINQIHTFKKITYKNLYPAIDVEYIFHEKEGIKYTLILHPGADLSKVKMHYVGRNNLTLKRNGDLHLPVLFGDIIDHAPVSYYKENPAKQIPSRFNLTGSTVSFELDSYDHTSTVVIDPWTVTPGLSNSNKVWEVEHDGAGNAYIYGGDTPLTLNKYNSAGVLQWSYATPWDTSSYWTGTLITDLNGVSYITSGSNGEISKVSTAGALVWHNNPNGGFGPLFEYWHLSFNCDQTQLVVGGMRNQSPFPTPVILGAIMNINLTNGAVLNYSVVGYMGSGFLGVGDEVRSLCSAPNGKFYFMILDSVGAVNSALTTVAMKAPSGYGLAYGSPAYGVTNQGISAIRANNSFVYTQNGAKLDKRSLSTGAIISSVAITGGISNSGFGGNSPGNSGLDIDSCGNVYVGSGNAVLKYDANLNFLSSGSTGGLPVYDVSVSTGGMVLVCGPGYAQSINMSACNPMKLICQTCPSLNPPTQTNPVCNGAATGTATVSATGGLTPYTYSWSPSGGAGATASNLAAGTYTCTITDAGGCTQTQTVTITQPSVLTASASPTGASCSGTGSATCTASGGTGALTYSWTPSGGTAATASGLAAGTYTCTVTDSKGCTQSATTTITAGTGPTVTLSSQANLSCNGINNGSATVTASAGTSPYTYSWSPSGGTGATASGLAAGTYTVTVTDAGGCIKTQTVTITQPSVITASSTSTNTSCGSNTGTATATASGGTGTLTYSWSPAGGNAAAATALAGGSYTCTVTDANGCTQTTSVTVNSTGGPTLSAAGQTNDLCNGGATGTASVSATAGTTPYTYSWSPSGGAGATASSLTAGVYTVIVKDASGCVQSQTFTITEPSSVTATSTSTNTGCGASTGTASVTASGGTGAYTYSWSPSGGTGATASALAAGTYTCTITDANGCTKTTTSTVTSSGGPTVTLSAQTNPLCNGGGSGSATVNVTSGTGPYTYSWNTTPSQTGATATGLAAGTYTVMVSDAGGCTQLLVVTITQPTAVIAAATSVQACGLNNGSAHATVSGGTGPYTYSWSPSGGNLSTASGLTSGTYTCSATDANGCVKTTTVSVQADSLPVATAGPDVTISLGGSTTLHASGGGTYLWTPAVGLSSDTSANPTASPVVSETYCVRVRNSHGCVDSSCVRVKVDITCGQIFVPNFFSPNADGKNDQLCVYGACIQTLDFIIYDRWGEKVYETTDPTAVCWDGVYKGKPMNTAVFVYYLKGTLLTGEAVTQKGNISLVR